jgi:hypothetical protein
VDSIYWQIGKLIIKKINKTISAFVEEQDNSNNYIKDKKN